MDSAYAEAGKALSQSQSLIESPSLVTGLYTRTRTKIRTGETFTAQAMGGVHLCAVHERPDGSEIVAAACYRSPT